LKCTEEPLEKGIDLPRDPSVHHIVLPATAERFRHGERSASKSSEPLLGIAATPSSGPSAEGGKNPDQAPEQWDFSPWNGRCNSAFFRFFGTFALNRFTFESKSIQ
jgi:hypothetical protein